MILGCHSCITFFTLLLCICRSSLPTPEHVQATGSCTSSSGSDTPSKSEFKQVKLHAQNQTALLRVLTEEKEQVLYALCAVHFVGFQSHFVFYSVCVCVCVYVCGMCGVCVWCVCGVCVCVCVLFILDL